MEFRIPVAPSGQYTYYPGTCRGASSDRRRTSTVSYKVLAEIEVTRDAEGVIFAQGSRFGGHSLFIKDGRLTYAYNFLGIPPETAHHCGAPAHWDAHRRYRLRQGTRRRPSRVASGRASCTSTTRSSPRPICRPRRGTSPCAAKVCASATTVVTR